jgi:hypothetical protein
MWPLNCAYIPHFDIEFVVQGRRSMVDTELMLPYIIAPREVAYSASNVHGGMGATLLFCGGWDTSPRAPNISFRNVFRQLVTRVTRPF